MTERSPWQKERQVWNMAYIEIHNLTKDYGRGRGIFDLNLEVEKGEVFGFVGINGAGKTTTIRHLMGFLKAQSGSARIAGMDCWTDAAQIKKLIGYVPGEIAFPPDGTGTMFLKRQMAMFGKEDDAYIAYLCDRLQLDATANLKSMSKGMKQKTALVAAFMHKPDILLLDEPSTGLDPLMRDVFLDLIKEQRDRGCTVFMSSHIFGEMEEVCDRVALIKDGRIATVTSMDEIRHNQNKTFKIEFKNPESFRKFLALEYDCTNIQEDENQLTVNVHDSAIQKLMADLSQCDVLFFKEIKHTLEAHFHTIFKEGTTE